MRTHIEKLRHMVCVTKKTGGGGERVTHAYMSKCINI